jgi:ubiquinone/menaquinone biosynthesis C-methylase UbiE
MHESQHDVVRQEFRQQAARFGEQGLTLSNQAYLQWMVEHLDLRPHFEVLDVAAGTGHLSRAMAPHVKRVVGLDLTPEMLAQGRHEATQQGLTNLVFEQGEAEHLPYSDQAFDLVTSRFSLHHFADPRGPLQEMVRVCRRGGKVAIIDLVSPGDPAVAFTYNHLERLRDPSHTRALTADELQGLMREAGLDIVHTVPRDVEVHLDRWLDLTQAAPAARQAIREVLSQDLQGLKTTGMRPYMRDQELKFLQAWLVAVGVKGGDQACSHRTAHYEEG